MKKILIPSADDLIFKLAVIFITEAVDTFGVVMLGEGTVTITAVAVAVVAIYMNTK